MWLKVHLMCGVKTNIVTSVEISDGYANDYHYFKGLVARTGENGFSMKEVSADKAYLGGENLLVTLRQGAIPYIPFKSNSKFKPTMVLSQNFGHECSTFTTSTARSFLSTITSVQMWRLHST